MRAKALSLDNSCLRSKHAVDYSEVQTKCFRAFFLCGFVYLCVCVCVCVCVSLDNSCLRSKHAVDYSEVSGVKLVLKWCYSGVTVVVQWCHSSGTVRCLWITPAYGADTL
jgi:hypothetical protein